MKGAVEQPPATAGIVMANWYWRVVRQFVSERFGISLSRSSCLNWLHRLGFACKRPKKRLLKADESKREAFVAEYAVLWEEAQRTGAIPIPRWDVHFGEIDDDRKDSTGPHITFRPQLGGHR